MWRAETQAEFDTQQFTDGDSLLWPLQARWLQHVPPSTTFVNYEFCPYDVYRVSKEECAILRESVPYVKLYRYNPKHLYAKLNGYADNGQISLKLWQLLHTYWLPNTYWNWQEYVVSVMLISVLNIKVTCEWHKAIRLNYKNTRINTCGCLRVPSTCISSSIEVLSYRVGRGSSAVKLANVRARKQSYDHW